MDNLKAQQQNVLSGLREAHERLQRDERDITRLVAAAREHDASWSAIGSVLAMSKQAAWQRFGKNDPHPTRRKPPEED